MGFSRQAYWSGLPFPSPADHVLSELSNMTCPSRVALQVMAHSFRQMRPSSLWPDWFIFCHCGFQSACTPLDKDKRLIEASEWRDCRRGKLGLVLMGGAMLSKSLTQFSIDGWSCVPSLLFEKWKWSHSVRLFATPWTIAYQDPLSMGFSRQEYWSGLPLPSLIPIACTLKCQVLYF